MDYCRPLMTLISVFREMISRTIYFELTLLSNRFHRAPDCCNLIVKFPDARVTLWRAIFQNEWPLHGRNHVMVFRTKLPICFPKIPLVGGTVDDPIRSQRLQISGRILRQMMALETLYISGFWSVKIGPNGRP